MEILLELLLEFVGEGIAQIIGDATQENKHRRRIKKMKAIMDKIKNVEYERIVKIVFAKNKIVFYYENKKALKLKFSKLTDNIDPVLVKDELKAKLEEVNYLGELIIKE